MPKPTLKIPIHDGAKFTWMGRHGITEASDLGFCVNHNERNAYGGLASRVWNDACDVGFWIKSPKTGKCVLFTNHEELKHDGEVVGWVYRSHGDIEAFQVTIYND